MKLTKETLIAAIEKKMSEGWDLTRHQWVDPKNMCCCALSCTLDNPMEIDGMKSDDVERLFADQFSVHSSDIREFVRGFDGKEGLWREQPYALGQELAEKYFPEAA